MTKEDSVPFFFLSIIIIFTLAGFLANPEDFVSSQVSVSQDPIHIDGVLYSAAEEQCIYANRAKCERVVIVLYKKIGQ